MEYLDAERNLELLEQELAALRLPGFHGVARLVKRRGPNGMATASAPYLLVEVDPLEEAQRARLDEAIAAHDPTRRTPAEARRAAARAELEQRRSAATAAVLSLGDRAAGGDRLAQELIAILSWLGMRDQREQA